MKSSIPRRPRLMGRGRQEDQGALRGVAAEVAGQLDQGGYAGGLFGPRGQRRNHGHGVVVRLDNDDVVPERRPGPGDGPEDVPRRSPLPIPSGTRRAPRPSPAWGSWRCARAGGPPLPGEPSSAAGREASSGTCAPPPGKTVESGSMKTTPGGSEVGALEPGVAGVEVHQHHRVFDLLAVEVGMGAVAAVDQARHSPAIGQGGGLDEVGPQAVQRGAVSPVAVTRRLAGSLFHRNGDVVFMGLDPGPARSRGRSPGCNGQPRRAPGYPATRDCCPAKCESVPATRSLGNMIPDRGKVDLRRDRRRCQRDGTPGATANSGFAAAAGL